MRTWRVQYVSEHDDRADYYWCLIEFPVKAHTLTDAIKDRPPLNGHAEIVLTDEDGEVVWKRER